MTAAESPPTPPLLTFPPSLGRAGRWVAKQKPCNGIQASSAMRVSISEPSACKPMAEWLPCCQRHTAAADMCKRSPFLVLMDALDCCFGRLSCNLLSGL